MNPFKLEGTAPGDKHVSVWACGECLHACISERHAQICCAPAVCKCGAESRRPWTICDKCLARKREEKERARYNGALKVRLEDYEGKVVAKDGDYHSADDVRDYPDEYPPWMYGTTEMPMFRLDADDVVEPYLDDHHEDARDELDLEDLQKRLDDWCSKQSLVSYMEDWSTVVVIRGAQ